MVVPESMKLNKFKVVKIPTNEEIYNRFGKTSRIPYSGDQEAIFDTGKIAQMEAAADINDELIVKEINKD